MTTIDKETGIRDPDQEPLRSLRKLVSKYDYLNDVMWILLII